MKLYLGCDHAAFEAKEEVKKYIESKGHEVEDFGCHSVDRCDYPDFAGHVAQAIQKEGGQGVLLCGSGIGISMAANRYACVRAALCRTPLDAELSRQHNDSNVLCVGARVSSLDEIKAIFDAWMAASFEEGRHVGRIEKFNNLGISK